MFKSFLVVGCLALATIAAAETFPPGYPSGDDFDAKVKSPSVVATYEELPGRVAKTKYFAPFSGATYCLTKANFADLSCTTQCKRLKALGVKPGRLILGPDSPQDDKTLGPESLAYTSTVDNKDGKFYVISFRGTFNGANWQKNFQFKPVEFPYAGENVGNTHRGFLETYKQLRTLVVASFKEAAQQGRELVLTGHSLGGALAHIAAIDLMTAPETKALFPPSKVHLVTYASPRVGGPKFAKKLDAIAFGTKIRYTTAYDIVPQTPGEVLFEHISGEVHYREDPGQGKGNGKFYACGGREDERCNNHQLGSFKNHELFLGGQYFGKGGCTVDP